MLIWTKALQTRAIKGLVNLTQSFIFRFVVPQLSFLNWKQVYTQISAKEI